MSRTMNINKELCEAIRNDDFEAIERFLNDKADPHAKLYDGTDSTPWHHVFSSCNTTVACILLEHGADPNYIFMEYDSQTAIFGAIFHLNATLIEVLVLYGADIN